jgi:endoribonuclease Dicer
MTPNVLLDALTAKFIDCGKLNVIVFDECHRAVKNHAYASILEHCFNNRTNEDSPLIIGLTASVLNADAGKKPDDLQIEVNKLQKTFRGPVVLPGDQEQREITAFSQ